MNEIKKAVLYARVSSEQHQGMNSNGMVSQIQMVRKFAADNGFTIVEECIEVVSGAKRSDRDRPMLKRALDICKVQKATLISKSLDRISRNAHHLSMIDDSGINIKIADAPYLDKFTIGILALVAQKEREMIQKRVKDALCICRQNNIKLGTRTPELNVRLMNEGARKARIEFRNSILPIVYEIKSTGVFTLQGIASCLSKRGVRTRTGKGEWQATQIRNLLVD